MSEWIANFLEWLLDFSNILNASIAASWMVLAVIVLRFLLKKAPRWIHVALWGLVAVRLLLPFSIESSLSLIPSAETIPHELLRVEGTQLQEPAYLDVVSNPIFTSGTSVEIGQTIDRVQINMMLMTLIWLIGIAVLLVYTIISFWCLRRKVSEAVILRDNIFQSENAGSPFVLGIIKPRIYLPYKIEEQTLVHVIAHEQAHIQRKDHWWKPLGFLLLTIHWFNPLMWLGYVLLCRDIELACDEKVIKDIDNEQRANYSQALVTCSVKRPMITACPLAFGEVGVKERVKSVLNYKKPAFWIIVVAVIACIVLAICFLTSPKVIDSLTFVHQETSVGQRADFMVNLGKNVKSAELTAELWQNGEFTRSSPVVVTSQAKKLTLLFSDRREGLNLIGENIQIDTDGVAGSLVTYFAFPEHIVGWAFTTWQDVVNVPVKAGEDVILAAMACDTGNGVRSIDCQSLTSEPERLSSADCMVVIRAKFYETDVPDTVEDSAMQWAERPMLVMDGKKYMDPYKPESTLPYGYSLTGTLTAEQAYNTGLEGTQYYTNPNEPDIFYTYQLCGTPTSIDEVDSENRNWQYLRWISADADALKERKLTLDDVRWLAQKGDALSWDDFDAYQGTDIGSGLYIMQYVIDDLFDVLVGGGSREADPAYVHLRNRDINAWVDIRTDDVDAFIKTYAGTDNHGGADSLDTAISSAILKHYASNNPDGLIHVESHVLLANESMSGTPLLGADDHGEKVTAYLLVYHVKYSTYGGTLEAVGGSYVPTAITFKITDSGEYVLEEYWEPRDGSYYAKDIRGKFPGTAADDALNDQAYIEDLKKQNYNKALSYLNSNISLDVQIEELLNEIQSSPAHSSNPKDYIREHESEYNELIGYGKYTLQYCFSEFLKGEQTGLLGHIMALVCQDIADALGEKEEPLENAVMTGQDWFDGFFSYAQVLAKNNRAEDLEKYYPATFLLLQMSDDEFMTKENLKH